MLKLSKNDIVLFSEGEEGGIVARYLGQHLSFLRVHTVYGSHQPAVKRKDMKIFEVEQKLKPYIGKVSIIVILEYFNNRKLAYLRAKYPGQKFLGLRIDEQKIKTINGEYVAILAKRVQRSSQAKSKIKNLLPNSRICYKDTSSWSTLIADGMMTKEILQANLSWEFDLNSPRIEWRKKQIKPVIIPSDDKKVCRLIARTISYVEHTQQYVYMRKVEECRRNGCIDQLEILTRKRAKRTESGRRKPRRLVVLDLYLWEHLRDLEWAFGGHVEIIDFRKTLLADICRALKMRGISR